MTSDPHTQRRMSQADWDTMIASTAALDRLSFESHVVKMLLAHGVPMTIQCDQCSSGDDVQGFPELPHFDAAESTNRYADDVLRILTAAGWREIHAADAEDMLVHFLGRCPECSGHDSPLFTGAAP